MLHTKMTDLAKEYAISENLKLAELLGDLNIRRLFD